MNQFSTLTTIAFVIAQLFVTGSASSAEPLPVPSFDLSERAVPIDGMGLLDGRSRSDSELWRPRVNKDEPKKRAASLYPTAAPAIVVIRNKTGHGTGFLMDEEGWIVTNRHVISSAPISLQNARRTVMVHFGRIRDGFMELDKKSYPAFVYATDQRRDLALLELAEKPGYFDSIAPLRTATKTPEPGDTCTAIGHPASGMLWTTRRGEVSGVGIWPSAHIETMMKSLVQADAWGSSRPDPATQRKVILTTCPINPGDSGGPILDSDGNIIGITFGIPRNKNADVSWDKFSYHVHVDELVAFVSEKPPQAEVVVPSTFSGARISELIDSDGDDRWDTWLMGTEPGEKTIGYMVDLDQDSRKTFKEKYIEDPRQRAQWDYEFAITKIGGLRAFYDRDNDGETDLVLADIDGDLVSDLSIALQAGVWSIDPRQGQPMIDPTLFSDSEISKVFAERFAQN